MKSLLSIIVLLAIHVAMASGQTFTQRLQQKAAGKGTITIHHDAAIDALVNGAGAHASTAKETAKATKPATTGRESADKVRTVETTPPAEQPTQPIAGADTRKKVMVGGTKVDGYRVQAFAGGNSRADRQKAEQVGNDIKLSFPDEPVYVHFYSPRWICRVGNYRNYEEAHQMLLKLREMGYDKATIVKGKITVQY